MGLNLKSIIKNDVAPTVKNTFKNILNNVTPAFTNAVSSAMKSAANNLIYGDVGSTGRVSGDDISNINKSFDDVTKFNKIWTNNLNNIYENRRAHGSSFNGTVSTNKSNIGASSESNPFETYVPIPRWGYKDFINERVSWQKSLDSLTGEPGWFYFKIFFKFDTNYGLFPGILGPGLKSVYGSQNSAINYLNMIDTTNSYRNNIHYSTALVKFVKTLSWINSFAPWFFKKITGMENANYLDLNEMNKERYIEIECSEDAVDMRLTTLIDLYRYFCYDHITQKEILPENLRKFDMSVVIFHTPLRYYHTAGKSLTQGSFPYKSMHADEFSDRMSFRMVTFSGCEFDLASMTSIPNELNNEKAFNIGQNRIKIKYNRAITTSLNEWFKFIVSDAGNFAWDAGEDLLYQLYGSDVKKTTDMSDNKYKEYTNKEKEKIKDKKNKKDNAFKATTKISNSQKKRINAIKYAIDHSFFYNPKSVNYKSLIDASEDIITNGMRMIKPKEAFGNLYGKYCDVNGEYYANKLQYETGRQFGTTNHNGHTHRVIPDYKGQKPENQHVKPDFNLTSMHNKDISDANNPRSEYYQELLRKLYRKPNNNVENKKPIEPIKPKYPKINKDNKKLKKDLLLNNNSIQPL